MSRSTTRPIADPARQGTPGLGALFVLIQTEPRPEVLATSFDRQRLLDEAMEMASIRRDASPRFRWFIRPAGVHLA